MINKLYRILLLIMLSIYVTGCNDDLAPIEADDFGFPKITVSAVGKNITGQRENQLAEWIDSGQMFNGDQAVIMVYNNTGNYFSMWCGWGCNRDTNVDSRICAAMRTAPDCIINQFCPNEKARYQPIANAPCRFVKGQGFYVLVTDPNSSTTDPNKSKAVNRMPNSAGFTTAGLWFPTNMYHGGSPAGGYNNTLNAKKGGRAYFKILDRYYDDNSGFFFASLKRGFTSAQDKPIAAVIRVIKNALDQASKTMFNNIIRNTEYRTALKAGLLIYMMVMGALFVGGVLQMSQKELVYTFMRLIVVIQLVTTTSSWELFNNYFFTFFTGGLNELIGIVTKNISGGVDGISFFDNVLGLLFSYETTTKIFALLVSFPTGFIVILLLYTAFFIFIIAIAKAVMMYLLSMIAISLLIVMAPIFLTFMLFESTKSIFEGWISQFANYFFQPLLVFASLSLFGQVIIDKMYRILGFKACFEPWLKIGDFVLTKMWKICNFNSQQAVISVPGYGFWDDGDSNRFCAPYECTANRYIDLPFLSPRLDWELIKAFEAPYTALNVPMLFNAFILLLFTFLLLKFHDTVPNLAKGIAGTSDGSSSNMLADTAASSLGDIKSAMGGMKNMAMESKYGQAARAKLLSTKMELKKNVKDAYKNAKDKVGEKIPDSVKKAGAKVGSVAGAVGGAAKEGGIGLFKGVEFLTRVAIPPGSLRSAHLEESREDQERRMQGVFGSSALGRKLQTLSPMHEIEKKASLFDYQLQSKFDAVTDAIGRKTEDLVDKATSSLGDPTGSLEKRKREDTKREELAIIRALNPEKKEVDQRGNIVDKDYLKSLDNDAARAQALASNPERVKAMQEIIAEIRQEDAKAKADMLNNAREMFKGDKLREAHNQELAKLEKQGVPKEDIATLRVLAEKDIREKRQYAARIIREIKLPHDKYRLSEVTGEIQTVSARKSLKELAKQAPGALDLVKENETLQKHNELIAAQRDINIAKFESHKRFVAAQRNINIDRISDQRALAAELAQGFDAKYDARAEQVEALESMGLLTKREAKHLSSELAKEQKAEKELIQRMKESKQIIPGAEIQDVMLAQAPMDKFNNKNLETIYLEDQHKLGERMMAECKFEKNQMKHLKGSRGAEARKQKLEVLKAKQALAKELLTSQEPVKVQERMRQLDNVAGRSFSDSLQRQAAEMPPMPTPTKSQAYVDKLSRWYEREAEIKARIASELGITDPIEVNKLMDNLIDMNIARSIEPDTVGMAQVGEEIADLSGIQKRKSKDKPDDPEFGQA